MNILVTNDDGIDSVGLHVLARALRRHGDVVVAAPDGEYSGSGASLGAIHLMQPELHRAEIDGIDESWAISAPPAMCVLFSRLGAFGRRFDLVVSGINPGINVGRSVYHSGTVGAALTARNGGTNAIAVSQEVEGFGVEGQGWDDVLDLQLWDTAAEVAAVAAGAILADPPDEAQVLNINLPNCRLDELEGWKLTSVGGAPPRTLGKVSLEPKRGHEGTFKLKMEWGEATELPEHTDGGAVMHGYVSLSWLSRLEACTPQGSTAAEKAIDQLLG
ncbi:MAG: hypothetical protein OEW42_12445 [Acidimicrobiia bacterium]|nr:hypothetical protein [Acidimicrobiia bacterium]